MAKIKPTGKFKSFSNAMGKGKAARKSVDRVARASSQSGAVFKGEMDKVKARATKYNGDRGPASLSNRKARNNRTK